MRLVIVVQRYGEEVAGGAEAAARLFCEHLGRGGHAVTVVTSCAVDYETWANDLRPGTEEIGGVEVVRLPVRAERTPARFGPVHGRLLGTVRAAPALERSWMQQQGPLLVGLDEELRGRAASADAVSFFTYLYPPTVLGLPGVAPWVPTLVHPAAHDEPTFRRQVVRPVFDHAAGIAYFTPEEQRLVERRWRPSCPSAVLPLGFDRVPVATAEADAAARRAVGVDDGDYLLYVGRLDVNKGVGDLLEHHRRSGERRGGRRVPLVLVGADHMGLRSGDGVIVTGFVDEATKWALLRGALALVQPSYQESFSIALVESWLAGRPVLAQRRCEVLAGFTGRARGGCLYEDAAEFGAAVDLLVERPELATALGASGRAHVEAELPWSGIAPRYEDLVTAATAHHERRRSVVG